MAREIIILGVQNQPDGSNVVSGVFWLVAPPAGVRPRPSATSAVPSSLVAGGPSWGYTQAELAAIQAGTIVEEGFTTGQLTGTVAAKQAIVQAMFAAAQNALNAVAPASHWIGAFWDGASWTAAP